jgi:hypothetical protein
VKCKVKERSNRGELRGMLWNFGSHAWEVKKCYKNVRKMFEKCSNVEQLRSKEQIASI